MQSECLDDGNRDILTVEEMEESNSGNIHDVYGNRMVTFMADNAVANSQMVECTE
jgi:hypothetical protein